MSKTLFIRVPVPGYEGLYEACSSGRIWSVERETVSGKHGKPLKYGGKYLDGGFAGPYKKAVLCRDGKPWSATVHSVIALAFIGPRPEGLVINHIDGDKLNNRPENLEYCTLSENHIHARLAGLFLLSGENNPNYKHGRYVNERRITTLP